MKVKATQKGYFGQVREAGEEFEVPKGTKGSWFFEVEEDEPEPEVKGRGRPPKHKSDDTDETI